MSPTIGQMARSRARLRLRREAERDQIGLWNGNDLGAVLGSCLCTVQRSGIGCRFRPFLLLRCVIFSMAVFCTHFVHLSEKCKWYGNYNILNIRYLDFHKKCKRIIYPGLLDDVIACRVPQGR